MRERAANIHEEESMTLVRRLARAAAVTPLLALSLAFSVAPARAAETLNAYSIWPENWARPMFEEFEKATGIKVNFVRFSSGEALARVIAEKNNPQVDVLFGGPVETFAAGVSEGVFEPYKPSSFAKLPARFRHPDGQWIAIADDPLVFMANAKFLKDNNLKAPASWNDLLAPPYKNMLQMADARTSGTAVTRIFSILEVNGRDENKAFDYMKKLRPNVQLYTKSGGGGTLPVGLGQAGAGIFFIVDALDTKAKGYDVVISFPKEGIGTAAEGIALIKGAKNPALGKKLIDWASSPAMQNLFAKYKINFVPAHPDVALEPSLAGVLKEAKIFPIDADYAGANRKRVVDRWVAEVLNP
jgi:iron(III) transport system substrate-binding protein